MEKINLKTISLLFIFLSISAQVGRANTCGLSLIAVGERAMEQEKKRHELLTSEATTRDLSNVAEAIQNYVVGVQEGSPFAAEKLNEQIALALKGDPTKKLSASLDEQLRRTADRNETTKQVAQSLLSLNDQILEIAGNVERNEEETPPTGFLAGAKRMALSVAKKVGIQRQVRDYHANNLTSAENIGNLDAQITAVVESAQKERDRIYQENLHYQQTADASRADGVRLAALAKEMEGQIEQIKERFGANAAPVYPAQVALGAVQTQVEIRLAEEKQALDAVGVNNLVIEQITAGINQVNTTGRLRLSSIATAMSTAIATGMATNLAQMNTAIDKTAGKVNLGVARTINNNAKLLDKSLSNQAWEKTQAEVTKLLEKAKKITENRRKIIEDDRPKRIETLLKENDQARAANDEQRTRYIGAAATTQSLTESQPETAKPDSGAPKELPFYRGQKPE